jgi:Arc/MetJ-type ribon-helix-helix transcriptional regulator
MAERAISVRLDSEAQRALERLTGKGTSQSQAIRDALVSAARSAWLAEAESDAKRLAESSSDVAEVAAIRAFFDEPDAAR